ncbi:MAG: hypothetical protein LBJ00_02155, partial [Planctomycetaceae bacterium]|nr:hypothetical protein [Planctomycetaceae bacterium]
HITGNASTGTIPAGTPDIFLKVKKKTTNAYGTEKTSSKITAGTTIELEMDDLVQNKVGNETLEFEYSWCYKDGTTEIPIPGSFTSTHKCYTIIDTPHSPWGIGTGTGAGETPWLAVVDASCKMAEGVTCSASDPKPLYVKMEKAINELEGSIDNVPSKLKYDVSGGKPNYVIENGVVVMPPLVTVGHFRPYPSGQLRLSNFLLFIKEDRSTNEGRLSGRTANMVNCSDCAFLLTTFANALGGDLRVAWITNYDSNYGLQGFTLNPIVPVGSDHFETIQFTPTGRFSYHAVSVPASTTAIPLDASTSVYDACLKLGIPDPTKKVNGGKVKEGDCKLSAGLPFDVPDNLQVVNIDGNLSGEINCNPVLGTVPDIFGINAKYEITVNNPATTCSIKRDDKVVDPHHNLSATRTTDGVNINFTAGTVSVGKKFSFDTQYNYNEYRALLSSPGNNGRGRCVWLHQKSITID